RITVMRSHNFEHAGTAKTFEGFGGRISLAFLGCKERVPNVDPDLARGRPQISERRSNPSDGLQLAIHLHTSIHILLY
ncbi:MAG TPA: hypothetical protein VNK23_07775, partial [Candidatus Dormibacteraeota bacterium]|nr:hypothetical protein [Candidatus Dormibacteraeota bacterium]